MSSHIPNYALYGDEASPSWLEVVHIEQIHERSSLFDFDIAPHVHHGLIQVLFLTQGGGEVFIDGRHWRVQAPGVVVVPTPAVHGFRFERDVDGPVVTAAQQPLESLAAVAAPALLRHVRAPRVMDVSLAPRHAEALLPLFEAIAREGRVHRSGQPNAGTALLLAVFVQIARLVDSLRIDEVSEAAGVDAASLRARQGLPASADETDPEGPALADGPAAAALARAATGAERATREGRIERSERSRKAERIERFRALVDGQFRTRWSIERYAEEVGLSAGQLSRLCRELLGMSALDVLNGRIVHEAQRELVYSNLSIKQVASVLGFADEAYFGRFFRKQTGHTPTEFRAAARAQLAPAVHIAA